MTDDAMPASESKPDSPYWLLIPLIFFFLTTISLLVLKYGEPSIPNGKAYAAVGSVIDCQPITGVTYRSYIRTPKDEVFAVYWRRDHQAPTFGIAIGVVRYHECGVQDGTVVHCFDSFTFSGEGAKNLDLNGKPVSVPLPSSK